MDNMIDLDKIDDLARLYRLFVMVPGGLLTLRKYLKESVLRRGREVNETNEVVDIENDDQNQDDETKPKGKSKALNAPQTADIASKWVERVLALKDKFDRIWKTAFNSDHELETALNEVSSSMLLRHGKVS